MADLQPPSPAPLDSGPAQPVSGKTQPAPGAPTAPESLPRQLLGLVAWVGSWLLLEALFRGRGLEDRQQLLAQLGILVVAGGFTALAVPARLNRLLTSVRFAVAQGLFLLAAVLLPALAGRAGVSLPWPLQEPFARLWGGALLALLSVSALAVAWKRRPYDAARLGFLLVHAAPALLLLGILWGRWDGFRGQARLLPGATVERLEGAAAPLPGFALRLEPAAAEMGVGPKLYAFLPGEPALGVREVGAEGATLGAHGYQVEVLRALPDAVETGQVVENLAAPAAPALQVVLGLGLEAPLVGNLFALDPARSRQDEPGGRFAVVFREAWDDRLADELRPTPARSETLELTSGDRVLRHSGKPGESWRLPGFTLRVTQVYPDFAVRPGANGAPEAFSRSGTPREPWAQLDLAPDRGPARRLLLSARHPALSDRLNAPNLPPGTTLHYLRDGEEPQRRFVLFTRNDLRVRLLEDGKVVRQEPLVLGSPFIVEKGLSVTAGGILEHSEAVYAPNPAPEQEAGRMVLHVRVRDPLGAAEERWLEPSLEPARFLGGRVGLGFREAPPAPGRPGPELVVLDALGHEQARQALAPGEDLRLRGCRILALPAAPDDPWAVRVQVAREPGLPLLAAAGISLLLGSAWMFYLKPVLKRRRAEQPKTLAAEGKP
jgi:hypothetical protein